MPHRRTRITHATPSLQIPLFRGRPLLEALVVASARAGGAGGLRDRVEATKTALQGAPPSIYEASFPEDGVFVAVEKRLAKAELARMSRHEIRERGLSQTEPAPLLGLKQPDVSELMRGKLSRFSIARLQIDSWGRTGSPSGPTPCPWMPSGRLRTGQDSGSQPIERSWSRLACPGPGWVAGELFHLLTWDSMPPDRVEPTEVPGKKGNRVEKLAGTSSPGCTALSRQAACPSGKRCGFSVSAARSSVPCAGRTVSTSRTRSDWVGSQTPAVSAQSLQNGVARVLTDQGAVGGLMKPCPSTPSSGTTSTTRTSRAASAL